MGSGRSVDGAGSQVTASRSAPVSAPATTSPPSPSSPTSPSSRPSVLVLGGGFGGLYAAEELGRLPVNVTVVDRRNYHLFQPMLYQVATAALNPSDVAVPIRSALRRHKQIDVVMSEVTGVNVDQKFVTLEDGSSIKYDYLIASLGLETSYFGNDVWRPKAPGLKSIDDALEIRTRVLCAFEQAERERDTAKRLALLTFVVVGGGPTGVEMAGSLAELRRYALAKDFRHIDPREAVVMLLEGGQRILPSFPEKLAELAKADLRRLGVDVRTEMLVSTIGDGCVSSAGWRIPTRTIVWAAGMRPSPLIEVLGAPTDRMGRVLVEPDSSLPGHPEVFVVGDSAHYVDPRYPQGLPGVAQVAMQSGRHAARMIAADLRKESRRPFHYNDKGQLAVIGRGRAVADIKGLKFGGFIAWFIWAFIHILFLIGFRNRLSVMLQWAWSYLTYEQGARLITGTERTEMTERTERLEQTEKSVREGCA